MPAYPGSDALLRLLVLKQGHPPSIGTAIAEDPLDPLVTGAGDAEVEGLELVRNVQAVIIPGATAAVGDLHPSFRLGWSPTRQLRALSIAGNVGNDDAACRD